MIIARYIDVHCTDGDHILGVEAVAPVQLRQDMVKVAHPFEHDGPGLGFIL